MCAMHHWQQSVNSRDVPVLLLSVAIWNKYQYAHGIIITCDRYIPMKVHNDLNISNFNLVLGTNVLEKV